MGNKGGVLIDPSGLTMVVQGCLDLFFFGGSWFATFSLMMSVILVLVELLMGSAAFLNGAAQHMAEEERQRKMETE